jgi:ABC-2 type transport system permease protein
MIDTDHPEMRPRVDPHEPGTEVRAGLRRTLELTWTLAIVDWKLKFFGSFLGYLWSLIRPFAFFGVIYVVFTTFAKFGNDVKHYGVYILLGLVLFNFFAEVTQSSLRSLLTRENLLRKMSFPRIVIPLSVTVTGLLNLASTMIAVFIFTVIAGVTPTWSWLQLVPLIGLLTLFTLGTGMILSVLFIRFRDIQPIWEVFAQVLFYISPIFYVATKVPESYQSFYLYNPLSAVLTQIRHAMVDPTAPSLVQITGTSEALVPLAIALGTAVLGVVLFFRDAPDIAEKL